MISRGVNSAPPESHLANSKFSPIQDNPRTISILVAAKANDVELELVNTKGDSSDAFNKSAEYTKLSPLGKIPAFEGANGYTLSEVIAIAVYGKPFATRFPTFITHSVFYDEQFLLLLVIPGRTNSVDNLHL